MAAKKKTTRRISSARTTKQYRKIAIGFLILTALLIAIIGYFAFTSTVITVTPAPVVQRANITTKLVKDSTDVGETVLVIAGSVYATTVTSSLTSDDVTPSGTADDIATGTVTIYNTWTQEQPLQATTRLLSPDGILFRIRNRVDVPAGGQVDNVEVYADAPGAQGEIGPARFTLPGLWPGLQDKIYAESFSRMTGGTRSTRIVTAENQSDLYDQVIETMRTEAQSKLDAMAAEAEDVSTSVQIIAEEVQEKTFSADVGEQSDQLTLDASIRFVGITYDPESLTAIAEQAIRDNLEGRLRLVELDPSTLVPDVVAYSVAQQTADLELQVEGTAVISSATDLFSSSKLTGKTEREIRSYFAAFDEVASVDIRFSPFWLKRTPSLADHIDIRLAE